MGILSTPDRGQPIDLAYIGSIVDAVNIIAENVSPTKKKYVTIDRPEGRQSALTSNAKFVAAMINVGSTNPASNSEVIFNYSFPDAFQFKPVVTATPVNSGEQIAGNDVTVVITDVSTTGVSGVARFGVGGSLSVSVNIIAIGIPN